MATGNDDALAEEARRWWVKLDGGRLSARERRAFERWLAKSAAHRAAFDAVEVLWTEMDGLRCAVPRMRGDALPARRAWRMGARLASVFAIAFWVGATFFFADPLTAWRADVQTAAGETRQITLADGSTVHLGADSALAIEPHARGRRVRLLRGEAWFGVRPRANQAFEVVAGDLTVTALETVFNVLCLADGAEATAIEDRIAVSTDEIASLVLDPGQAVSYSGRQGLGAAHRVDVDLATAWRRGRLIVEARPLGEVVEILDRFLPGRVVLVDPRLERLPVNGVFRMEDPMAVLHALKVSLGVQSTYLSAYLILLHGS